MSLYLLKALFDRYMHRRGQQETFQPHNIVRVDVAMMPAYMVWGSAWHQKRSQEIESMEKYENTVLNCDWPWFEKKSFNVQVLNS